MISSFMLSILLWKKLSRAMIAEGCTREKRKGRVVVQLSRDDEGCAVWDQNPWASDGLYLALTEHWDLL